MSWWSRSQWGEVQALVSKAVNGDEKILTKVDAFTRWVIDDVLVSDASTSTVASGNYIEFYNGDPDSGGVKVGPAIALAGGGNGMRSQWIRDLGLRFNRFTDVHVEFTFGDARAMDVFVNAHKERGK